MSDDGERMDPIQHHINTNAWQCGACAEHGMHTENYAERQLCHICGASRDDERRDPVKHYTDLAEEAEDERLSLAGLTNDGALLAFATNFELIKKLTNILAWHNIPADGQRLLFSYILALVDGAEGFIDQQVKDDAHTTELSTLFREVNDARDWLAEHMEAS